MCFSTGAMLDTVGFRWSLRITAVIVFFINLAATIMLRSRNTEIQPDLRPFNTKLLRSYEVKLLLGWSIVLMFGYITLMFSLTDYATVIGRSAKDSANVAACLNLGTALGRPLIGYFSDRYGRVQIASILTTSCGILIFAFWLPSTSYAAMVSFSLISGAILGVFWAVSINCHQRDRDEVLMNIQVIGPLAADLVSLKQLPTLLNLAWMSVALPSLCKSLIFLRIYSIPLLTLKPVVAEVIALEIRQPSLGSRAYVYAQVFAGISYFGASGLLWELWRVRRSKQRSHERSYNNNLQPAR
jgi:MFS family permease